MLINFAKWRAIATIAIGGLVVLSNFQNCAPAGVSASASVNSDPQMRVVDDWNKLKVDIIKSVVQVQPSDSVALIDGFCDRHNAAELAWSLKLPGEGEVLSGPATCEGGGFRLEVGNLDELHCGEAYDLSVHNADGEEDSTILVRGCGQ